MMSQELFFQILDGCLADARIRFNVQGRHIMIGMGPDCHKGDAGAVAIRVCNKRFFSRVLCFGNLGLAESFMDQDFEMEEGTLHDFLTILLRSHLDKKIKKHPRLLLKVVGTRLANMLRGKEQNVQRHYDVGDELFETFLDSTLTYSCGYANVPDDDLEQLQTNKLDRICRKLRLQHGESFLDIGCGFGGLLIHAAKHYGITGTGVTLSRRHCERGNAIIAREGLENWIRIEFKDYRRLEGRFDKVASVGMMEHVPRSEYKHYFKCISDALEPHGFGLVHTIGCNSFRNEHDPFIQKYVFPGSNQPRLSEIAALLERNGLAVLDVENMVRHYGYTVRCWLNRFKENRGALNGQKFDPVFLRMWEYYLSCGIAAAFASDSALYQVLFSRDYAADLPLRRV